MALTDANLVTVELPLVLGNTEKLLGPDTDELGDGAPDAETPLVGDEVQL